METVTAVLRVLLALSAAGPAPGRALYLHDDGPAPGRALYLRDDGPAAGYAAAGADEPHRKVPAHKRYYMGAAGQGNMKLVNERAVDSYFRILRPTPRPAAPAAPAAPGADERALSTGPPRDAYAPQRERHGDGERAPAGGGAERLRARNDDELFERNRKEYFRKHSVYEKHTVVSRGNKRHGRRPHLAQNYNQKLFLSQARGETFEPGAAPRAALDAHPPYGKGYRKRNTIDKESIPRRMDEHRNSLHYMNTDDGSEPRGRRAGAARAPLALFERADREAEPAQAALADAPAAYYKGSASSYVDLNVGRKGPMFAL